MIESADLAGLNGLVALDAVDLRAEVAELADDILIAALDIVAFETSLVPSAASAAMTMAAPARRS